MTLPELILLRPLWLLGLPLALVAAVLVARRTDGMTEWRAVVDADLLEAMRLRGYVTPPRPDPDPWLMALALALLCTGLAGPASRDHHAPLLRNRDALMILLDLSPSMTSGGGLDDAQAAISRLIDIGAARPTGLIVYAGESFLASIPTEDPATLQGMIAVVDSETMPVAGSRPDRALIMARRVLADAASLAPDVVLVSDGGGMGPAAADIARQMAEDGIRISGIFVPQDAPPYGLPAAMPERVQSVVEAGGGKMANASDYASVGTLLSARRRPEQQAADLRALQYRDLGPWLAALALLPLALLFRRRQT